MEPITRSASALSEAMGSPKTLTDTDTISSGCKTTEMFLILNVGHRTGPSERRVIVGEGPMVLREALPRGERLFHRLCITCAPLRLLNNETGQKRLNDTREIVCQPANPADEILI